MKRFNRLIVPLLMAAICGSGCQHKIERHVIRDEMDGHQHDVVVSATLRDGTIVSFDETGARYAWKTEAGRWELYISGSTLVGQHREISVAGIAEARIRTREIDGVGTTVLGTAVATVALVLYAMANFRVH